MADQRTAPPLVHATAPETSAAYQWEWAREWLRDRFWVIPSALLILGTGLAVVTVEAASLGIPQSWRSGFAADPGKASSFLGIIASATLTFLGVVFTLTLVALQLASSQLSPRVLRTFVRSGVTKAAFGTTGQTTLRWAVVLLFLLLVVASRFGLDVVLGAVLAGIVLRGWTRRANIDTEGLEQKFDALGYGFFIPVFFVWSGMTLDIAGIADNPLRVLIFFLLLLFTRGLPSMIIYRRSLPVRQRVQMTFITATGMPLLIALAEIGLRDGKMLPANAAALVGAGVLSVLVFPAAAVRLSGRPPGPRPGRPAPAELPSDSK